jgi:NAD(P)-dependent dehydrogenase (short-subunit alcohol dehydrogenase family)
MTVAWVTGAANGIGHAVAQRLTADGFSVVGIDLEPAPDCAASRQWDLSDIASWRDDATSLAQSHAPTAIVHCAARQVLGPAGSIAHADWASTFATNVVALDVLVGAGRTSLLEQRGAVVAVSSVHARTTTSGIAAYATSKAALEGWVRAAALDLAPHVRVNAVVPGAIDTRMLREGFARWTDEAAAREQALVDATPLSTIGQPDDIAAAVAFFVGPDSSFCTGTSLVVDGGVSAKLSSE